MNLTHVNKTQRDYLGPVNPNLTQHSDSANRQLSRDKDTADPKNNSNYKVQDLLSTIEGLRSENESMNIMIRTKNQQIHNLKTLLKQGSQYGPIQQNKNTREVYFLNGLPLHGESGTHNSVQLDRAIYLIKALTKERDDLKRHCEQLEQRNPGVGVVSEPKRNQATTIDPQVQLQQLKIAEQAKLIQQYEQHISSLSSKLSTVHKLETQISQLTQQRGHILNDFQNMRQELMNRVGYTEHLQNQLRHLQQQLTQRGPPTTGISNHPEFLTLMSKSNTLQAQIVKLNKIISEKDEKIAEIQIGKSGYVQVTKQAFESMQANINNLQQKINQMTDGQRKQSEKATNFQVQINRLTRQLSQKNRKFEEDNQKIERLDKQRNQLNLNFANAKADLKQLQRKYEDKCSELEKVKVQNQKNKKLSEGLVQVEKYKKLAKQSEQLYKNVLSQITKLETEYKNMKKENQQARDLVQESKGKWQSYEKNLKRQNEYIMKLNDACTKRLQQVDVNIEKNINLQTKLRELLRINDPLQDQIERYIKENQYVRPSDITY